MSDIESVNAKAIYPQSLKQIQPENTSDDSSALDIVSLLIEDTAKCSREVIIKIIDKVKQL